MAINYHNSKYVISLPNFNYLSERCLPKILLVGKSNVGKSSLINSLCNNKHLAKVSSVPGKTKYLNFFLIDNQYFLIDAPGYGFVSKYKNFNKMMNSVFCSKDLKGIIFILDSRRSLTINDKVFYNFLIDKKIPFFIVLSKSDKINQKERKNIINDIHTNFLIIKDEEIFFTNNKNKENIDEIKNNIKYLLDK